MSGAGAIALARLPVLRSRCAGRFRGPRPDRSWGGEAQGRDAVHVRFAGPERVGLREIQVSDGPCQVAGGALCPKPGGPAWGGYIYFQVSDYWSFDLPDGAASQPRLELWTKGSSRFDVEFDSHDGAATLHGAYTLVRPVLLSEVEGVRRWAVPLPRARFANRQNGGADFRLVLRGRDLAALELRLTRAPVEQREDQQEPRRKKNGR